MLLLHEVIMDKSLLGRVSNQPTEGNRGGSTQESSESVLYKSWPSDREWFVGGFEGIEDEKR